MTITIDLPETEAEAIAMLNSVSKNAGYNWEMMQKKWSLFFLR